MDAGEVLLLKYMLNYTASDNCKLRLYTNNTTPVEADTTVNYTESSAAGYALATLTGTSWTVSTTSNVTTAVYAERTFSYSTSETAYGYYVTNNAGNTVLWAERFTGAPLAQYKKVA